MVLSSDFILCFCGFCQEKTCKKRNNWHYEWTSLSHFQNIQEEYLIFIPTWLQMHKNYSQSTSHNERPKPVSVLRSTSVWYNKINALISITARCKTWDFSNFSVISMLFSHHIIFFVDTTEKFISCYKLSVFSVRTIMLI